MHSLSFIIATLALSPSAMATYNLIPRTGWTSWVDSYQPGNEASKAFDGNPATFWHTEYSPKAPGFTHEIDITLPSYYNVSGIQIVPRQDCSPNNTPQQQKDSGCWNGDIGQYSLALGNDSFTPGTSPYYFPIRSLKVPDDHSTISQMQTWAPFNTRVIQLHTETEAGGRGPWTSIGEIYLYWS